MTKKLYRSNTNKMLGGVCGGIGEYLSVDPTIIRLIAFISWFFGGLGIIAYIICLFIVPKATHSSPTTEYKYSASNQNGKYIIGGVLMLVGVIAFLQNFVRLTHKGLLPAIFILIGVYIIFGKKHSR